MQTRRIFAITIGLLTSLFLSSPAQAASCSGYERDTAGYLQCLEKRIDTIERKMESASYCVLREGAMCPDGFIGGTVCLQASKASETAIGFTGATGVDSACGEQAVALQTCCKF